MSKLEVTTATKAQHGAEDQLSGGERKPTTAAKVYDLFEQVRETMWGEADCLIDDEPVVKMRDDYALCVVAREAAELAGERLRDAIIERLEEGK